MIATLTDCCPRCGYVLDQPAPPAARPHSARSPASAACPLVRRPLPRARAAPAPRARRPQRRLRAQDPARARRHLPARRGRDLPGRRLVVARHRRPDRRPGRADRRDGAAGQWLARRDLGVAAEALTTVSLGLVVLDLFGAANAGWLGAPSEQSFGVMVGTSVLLASLGLCVPARRLFAPQVAAPLGLGLALLGVRIERARPGRGGVRRALLHGSRGRRPGALARWCCPGPPRPAPGWRSSASSARP